jgi:hypothetical protein
MLIRSRLGDRIPLESGYLQSPNSTESHYSSKHVAMGCRSRNRFFVLSIVGLIVEGGVDREVDPSSKPTRAMLGIVGPEALCFARGTWEGVTLTWFRRRNRNRLVEGISHIRSLGTWVVVIFTRTRKTWLHFALREGFGRYGIVAKPFWSEFER